MAVKIYAQQEMKGYIREKYDVPESHEIVIKQGYVIKDRANFLDAPPPKLPWNFVGPAAYYEIVPSGGDNMCDRCAEMAGRVFFGGDYEEGVTAPPFHPNCECSTREWREWEMPEGGVRKPSVPPEGILGKSSEDNIATLHPYIQENARMALYEMQQVFGKNHVRIVEGYRSPARSDSVSSDGSGVAGGRSNHNYGLAFDIGFFDENGRYMDGKNADGSKNMEELRFLNDLFARAGEIGRKYGFEWGGDWSSGDTPHFQMPYGYTWRDLINLPLMEGSDYLRQVDPDRKYQSQPDTRADSKPPVWEQ